MKVIAPGSIIGILGGGQLGKMSAIAAANLGYKVHIYTPDKDSPAEQIAYKTTNGSFTDKTALKKFAAEVDVITYEFENINNEGVKFLETIANVRPGFKALYISQNRLREKTFMRENKIPVTDFCKVEDLPSFEFALKKFKNKCILKTVEMGYDGKGQFLIKPSSNPKKIWQEAKIQTGIVEEFVPFKKEVSVVVCRSLDKKTACFPVTENVHESGILRASIAPANIPDKTEKEAQSIAEKIADGLNLVGVLCVEFFVTKDDRVLVNEIAPRPHNSGHWTIDGATTSQFEQHIRAICGLPLGSVNQHSKVKMLNLIGKDVLKWKKLSNNPKAKLHLYGKKEIREGRKMGHVTFVG